MAISNDANFSSYLRGNSARAYLILHKTDGSKAYHNLAFNPNELTVKAQHKPVSRLYFNKSNQGTSNQNSHVNAHVDLSVKLYFDSLDDLTRLDYSRMDEVQASLTTLEDYTSYSTTANKNTTQRGLYDQVNGLVQSLNNASTRKVEFCWNEFSFLGLVTGVQAEYTMFTYAGNPIRATVQLTLRQLYNNTAKQPYVNSYEAWKKMTTI